MGGSSSVPVMKAAREPKPEELLKYDQGDKYWTEKKDGESIIQYAEKGWASKEKCPTMCIHEMFEKAVQNNPNKAALKAEWPPPPLKKGQPAPPALPLDQWKTWTYKEYYEETCNAAAALISLGMEKHDAVSIFGFNSPFWFMAELSAMLAGGKSSGIYPSDTPKQVQFKSFHSDTSVAIVESEKQVAAYKEILDEVPYLKAIVVWNAEKPGDLPAEESRSDGSSVKVFTWDKFVELGKPDDAKAKLEERKKGIKPSEACALIYTSGTTGTPKAVMISHDNLIFECRCVLQGCMPFVGSKKNEQERIISYLPLSHVAGMMVDIMCPIAIGAFQPGYLTAHFARPYDLKAGSLGDRLKAVRPTLFLGVPRVWEKVAEKLKAVGAKTKGLKKKLATWAKSKGLAYQKGQQLGGTGEVPSKYGLAQKIVLSKIKAAIGLDECKFGFTGAAPISKDTLEYYGSLGININEVYGMSENTGAITWSTDQCHLWGSIGYAMPGCDVRVFKTDTADINQKEECPRADDIFNPPEECNGEICFRARNVMMGYMANPKLGDEHVEDIIKKNESTIDKQGFLHSGDMGCKSKAGMLRITGRYKELIIGAGGENIAPVPIEDNIKKLAPGISNIMMVGNQRKFNAALVTLKAVGATGESPGTDQLDGAALDVDPAVKTISEAMKSDKWKEYIIKAIKETGEDGSCTPSNAAKIQKFTILPADFSVETGELTATLKLKRSVVEDKHKPVIDKIYESSETYVPYEA